LYIYAEVGEISLDTQRRAVPLQQLSLMQPVFDNGFKTDYNAITKFTSIKLSDRQNTF